MKFFSSHSLNASSSFVSVFATISIKELRVPQSRNIGSNKHLILDCDYEVYNETGLEVKWFYNGDKPIFQWIPHRNNPQAIGPFKDVLDLSYKASETEDTMYRALYIKRITPSLTGNYTCKVSSDLNEAVKTKEMIIYRKCVQSN